jgi:hypothetical protein
MATRVRDFETSSLNIIHYLCDLIFREMNKVSDISKTVSSYLKVEENLQWNDKRVSLIEINHLTEFKGDKGTISHFIQWTVYSTGTLHSMDTSSNGHFIQ